MPSRKLDLRKLKPGQVLRLLNSTPQGEALDDRRLRAHRQRAGLRIGDGRSIDFVRYTAWLWQEYSKKASPSPASGSPLPAPASPASPVPEAYDARKERERARNAASSRSGRDIGAIPPVADPARRAQAEAGFAFFCITYFPERFPLAWSADHLRLIERIEATVIAGGLAAFAMPRGSGKTTISECAVLWAVLTGRRKFVALIGASKPHADEMLESIKGELETNELLAADFPEVCFPIAALEGIHNRCKGQLHEGNRTLIRWAGSLLVLPTIAGSKSSSAIICVRGITGRVRGMKFRRPDGENVRPDLCVIDDPQTDQSARSPNQCTKRLAIVTGAVLGLAGPGKKISAILPCTIIQRGDLADQVLDRKQHPEWQGQTARLVYEYPKNQELWDKYADLRRAGLRKDRGAEEATEFYRKHRAAMDEGAVVAWEQRKYPDELSALQHAMNLRIDSPATYDAEYENDPKDATKDAGIMLAVEEIPTRLSGLAHRVVPLAAHKLTAFVDVQHSLLYWMVCAWADDFSGASIDYGTWPDQQRAYFTLREARRTLQDETPNSSVQAAVLHGLQTLTNRLLEAEWGREDGQQFKIGRMLIDAQDGNVSDQVAEVCRRSPHKGRLLPSGGRSFGPTDKPLDQYQKKPGEQLGYHWLLAPNKRHAIRFVTIDTNFWKTFVHERLAQAAGERGGLRLYGRTPHVHRMLAEHCTAEFPTRVRHEKSQRVVDVWKLKPDRSDNHLFDCLVGCACAAAIDGCQLAGSLLPKPPPKPLAGRKRVRYLND